MSIVFQTERLTVRHYSIDDLPQFAELNADEDIMRYIRDTKTYDQSKRFLEDIIKMYDELSSPGRLAVERNDTKAFIGSFAVIPILGTDLLQVGYSLFKESWGKGYATELVQGSLPLLKEKRINQVYAITFPENIGSQKVLLKNGFVFETTIKEEGKELYRYVREKI